MSNNLKQVLEGIKESVAKTSYTELTHILNIANNKFTQGKRYGVVPRQVQQNNTNTQRVTQDYFFSIILTDTYISQSLTDKDIIEKIVELMSEFDSIHTDLINTKCNRASIVMLIDGFDISEPVVLEKEKTIIVESIIKVKCNYNLRKD